MENSKELWCIVPIGDGYHYVCETNDGKWFLQHKAQKFNPKSGKELVFKTESETQDYINCCLDASKFKPELCWKRMSE